MTSTTIIKRPGGRALAARLENQRTDYGKRARRTGPLAGWSYCLDSTASQRRTLGRYFLLCGPSWWSVGLVGGGQLARGSLQGWDANKAAAHDFASPLNEAEKAAKRELKREAAEQEARAVAQDAARVEARPQRPLPRIPAPVWRAA